jgi:xylan 1,4-beta-xylosidase
VWNYHDDDVKAPPASVEIRLNGLTHKQVRVEQFRMDDEHNNSYRAWMKMGSPEKPSAEQKAALKRAGKLEMMTAPSAMKVVGGKLTLPLELPRQGVGLLRISWR